MIAPALRLAPVLLLTAAGTLLRAAPASAQQKASAAGPRPGWLPHGETRMADMTPAQRAKASAVLEQLEGIFLRVPELARPEGFQIRRSIYGGGRPLGPDGKANSTYVVRYALNLDFYGPGNFAGHSASQCIQAEVNTTSYTGSRELFDDAGRMIYIEAARGNRIPFSTVTYGHLLHNLRSGITVAFVTADATPWKPATREQYYQAVLNEREGRDGHKLDDYRKALTTTPYQQWIEGAAQRKKDLEETVKMMRAIGQSAVEIEKIQKVFQDTERDVTERLKASEADDRTRNQDALELSHEQTARMRTELDAMGPAGRQLAAFVDNHEREGMNATGFTISAADRAGSWRVLEHNYDFWRARTSPVEVRTIHVRLSNSLGCMRPAIHKAVWAAYNKLDWAAFDRLLHVPAGEKGWRGGVSHELTNNQ